MRAELKINPGKNYLSSYDSRSVNLQASPQEDYEVIETGHMSVHKRAVFYNGGIVLQVKIHPKKNSVFFAESKEPMFKVTFAFDHPVITSKLLDGDKRIVDSNHFNAWYLPQPIGYFHLTENSTVETVELVFSKPQILNWLKEYGNHLKEFKNLIEKGKELQYFNNSQLIQPEMKSVITDLLQYNKHENWHHLSLETKINHLLMMVFDDNVIHKPVALRVEEVIVKMLHDVPKLDDLCQMFGISENALQAKFKMEFKTTIRDYAHGLKMKKAEQELKLQKSVKEVSFDLGYRNMAHFSRAFKKYWKITPKQVAGL